MAACRNFEAEIVEDRAFRLVTKADILESERRAAHYQCGRAGSVRNLDCRVHQIEHLRHVDHALPDRAIDEAEQIERAEELHQIGVHEHEIAHCQVAPAPPPHGIGHRARHQQVCNQSLRDVEHAERSVGLDRRFGIGARRLGVAFFLAVFGAEIFDRLVIQQRIHRARQGCAVEIVHLAPQMRTPFGDALCDDDIGDHCQRRRRHEPPAEIEIEDDAHGNQFDDRRRDVEEQEIEHGVDALRPALDDLGHLARAARQVEAQRQAVEAAEHVFGQMAGRFLPDALEHDVPEIVERRAGEPSQSISQHQCHGDAHGLPGIARHRIDRALVGERQRQRD